MNALTNGATIQIEGTNKKYHTLDDWELAIGNNDYIGDPEQELNYIDVVGRNSPIDVSDALIGRPSYKKREIKMNMGGIRSRNGWDNIISDIRNKIDGRIVHVIFDNDKQYYWRGRIHVQDFDRNNRLGTFTLIMPQADPYKYEVSSVTEPWLWDPFSFVDGVIRNFGELVVNGTATMMIPKGHMYTVPEFQVSATSEIIMTDGNREYKLTAGKNRFPSLLVNGDDEVNLSFKGQGTVTIDYRGGSL